MTPFSFPGIIHTIFRLSHLPIASPDVDNVKAGKLQTLEFPTASSQIDPIPVVSHCISQLKCRNGLRRLDLLSFTEIEDASDLFRLQGIG